MVEREFRFVKYTENILKYMLLILLPDDSMFISYVISLYIIPSSSNKTSFLIFFLCFGFHFRKNKEFCVKHFVCIFMFLYKFISPKKIKLLKLFYKSSTAFAQVFFLNLISWFNIFLSFMIHKYNFCTFFFFCWWLEITTEFINSHTNVKYGKTINTFF